MSRLPGLDLLRAIAIVWVMLFHALMAGLGSPLPAIASYGWMGVDLFFVLSGFLVGAQVFKPLARGESLDITGFYVRRAFRILPAYAVVLLLYYTLPSFREAPGMQPAWQFLTFTENLLIDYHANRAFSHAWSLCVEEHFYLCLPVIAWCLYRRPSLWTTLTLAIAVLVGGMLLRGTIWLHDLQPIAHLESGEGNFYQRYIEAIYYPTPTRLDGLLAGLTLAAVKVFRPAWWQQLVRRSRTVLAVGLAGFALALYLFAERFALVPAIVGFPLLSFSFAACVAAAADPHSVLGRIRVPAASLLAALAYSVYLTHKQIFHMVNTWAGSALEGHGLLAVLAYATAALAGGWLLHSTVERPFLRLRERLAGESATPRATTGEVPTASPG